MAGYVEKLREQRRKEKLAREYSYIPKEQFYNPIGEAITQWGSGVRERVTHPLATLAGEAKRWSYMTPEATVSELSGMLNPVGGLVSITAKKGINKLANMAYKNESQLSNNIPKTIYHGTTPQAAKSIEKTGFDLTKSADGSVWFTDNPNIGEVAASGKGGIVKRQIDTSKMKLAGWDEIDKYSVDELINMGYDGVAMPSAGEVTYQIFKPEKLITGK